jgi:P27 family predicted phage terminase small subunit
MAGRYKKAKTTNGHGTEIDAPEVLAPQGSPEKPQGLSDIASAEWDSLVAELTELGTISNVDRAAIEMAARYAGHYHEGNADVLKHGLLVTTKSGIKANPSIRARDDAARIRNSYLQQLGLTPVSRSRVHVPVADSGPSLEDVLEGRA